MLLTTGVYAESEIIQRPPTVSDTGETWLRERGRETDRQRENSELYCTRITILRISIFLQSVPANIHAKRLHIKQLNNREGREREREREGERGGGRERELRTLLYKDHDLGYFRILTICPC